MRVSIIIKCDVHVILNIGCLSTTANHAISTSYQILSNRIAQFFLTNVIIVVFIVVIIVVIVIIVVTIGAKREDPIYMI